MLFPSFARILIKVAMAPRTTRTFKEIVMYIKINFDVHREVGFFLSVVANSTPVAVSKPYVPGKTLSRAHRVQAVGLRYP